MPRLEVARFATRNFRPIRIRSVDPRAAHGHDTRASATVLWGLRNLGWAMSGFTQDADYTYGRKSRSIAYIYHRFIYGGFDIGRNLRELQSRAHLSMYSHHITRKQTNLVCECNLALCAAVVLPVDVLCVYVCPRLGSSPSKHPTSGPRPGASHHSRL